MHSGLWREYGTQGDYCLLDGYLPCDTSYLPAEVPFHSREGECEAQKSPKQYHSAHIPSVNTVNKPRMQIEEGL
jgi:hypothetical protein